MCEIKQHQQRRYASLHQGPPVERAWIVWHMSIGLGAGLLSWPSSGPPALLICLFLWSALTIVVGLEIESRKAVSQGLSLLAVASGLRAVAVWDVPQLGAGSNWIASFTWCAIAVGSLMESTSVRTRGLQPRKVNGGDGQVRSRDGDAR